MAAPDIFAELDGLKESIRILTQQVQDLSAVVANVRRYRDGIDGLNGIDGRDGRDDKVLATAIAYLAHKVKPSLPLPDPDALIQEMLGRIALPEDPKCGICIDRIKDCRLNCGHMVCRTCGDELVSCSICRVVITTRDKTYVT